MYKCKFVWIWIYKFVCISVHMAQKWVYGCVNFCVCLFVHTRKWKVDHVLQTRALLYDTFVLQRAGKSLLYSFSNMHIFIAVVIIIITIIMIIIIIIMIIMLIMTNSCIYINTSHTKKSRPAHKLRSTHDGERTVHAVWKQLQNTVHVWALHIRMPCLYAVCHAQALRTVEYVEWMHRTQDGVKRRNFTQDQDVWHSLQTRKKQKLRIMMKMLDACIVTRWKCGEMQTLHKRSDENITGTSCYKM